ncbi:TonB-dependent receptor [Agriterribacter sp.]|uniref:TonB-dependent receptor n=1 Tax=Agriterribacter sp. TaxID=2821509 RepID=UPI002BD52018|nr:TonB-dependent receptor [Agriterribacter sp.]HRO47810.1 TonB-dependent receptor [Agriterribacter sp.]HRQ19489.1 TonB-dependent receptor [Agriterribacter sp.]
MKLTIILLLTCFLQVNAKGYSQGVTLKMKHVTLERVLKEITKQTDYHVIYGKSEIAKAARIDVDVTNSSLEEVLSLVFKNQLLSYTIRDKFIVISPAPAPEQPASLPAPPPVDIKGTVLSGDDPALPLEGASVKLKGSYRGTTTNAKGEFLLQIPDESGTLVISFIGYETVEVAVSGTRSTVNVTLKAVDKQTEEVVVIGYGTQRKRDVTGAVSSVKTKDLVLSSGPEIGNMLKGKVAGLTIRQNSAQPGGGIDILVRGAGSVNASNAPLFVVDGFPITDLEQPESGGRYQAGTQSILNSFNPNDIESIEVLKDASATSIYGSRAANGVILITTKRGNEGALRVQYSGNYSVQKYNNPFDVLPLNEWMQVRNEAAWEQWQFDNNVYPYGTKTQEEAEANPVNGPFRKLYTQNAINNVGRGTDWFDLVTRDGATMQHNISLSGGTRYTKYLISGNYYDQKGIIKNSSFKRYSVRANIDQEINKYVKTGINLTASRIDNQNTQLGSDQYENSGIIRAAIQQGPHIPAIDEDGNYPLNPQLALQPNPYSLLTISDQGRIERLLGNFFIDIMPVQDLTVKLKAGIDRGITKRQNYLPTTTLHGQLEHGRAFISNSDNNSYLLEATANYTKQINEAHRFDLLAGVSQQRFVTNFSSEGATGFITDAFLWNNLGAGSIQLPTSSSGSKNMIASYFGRLNYNYKSRYYATVTVRTDGASVFAANNKWGTFPSAALAWNVAEEPFFAALKNTVSQLKIRLSYGQTGNATINSNAFAAYSAYPAWLSGNDVRLIGVSLSRLENPDLKWETTTGANLGVDFALFGGKVDGSIEIYNNVISDLLDTKSLNSYQEVNTIIANIGKTRSRGFEITVNTRNIQSANFQWRTMFALARYKDTWLERAPDWKPTVYESANDPIRAVYSRVADGIMQVGEQAPESQPELKPGMIKMMDINGFDRDANGNPVVDANGRFVRTGKPDGIIDDADTRLMGTSDPSLMAGITNIFIYKNFSLNFDFNALFGRRFADPNYTTYGVSAAGVYSNGYNALRIVKERWTPENPSATHPSSFYGWSPYGIGDFFVQDAWFIRLQNISLGYNLPQKIFSKVFSSARIHADVQNLFVISPYTGVDPETDSYTAAYPYIRTYTIGLNLNF